MKQIRYVVFSLVLILSLTACGTANKQASPQPGTAATNSSPSNQQTTVATSPSPSAQPNASQPTVSTPNTSIAVATPKPTTKATPKAETAVIKILSVTSPAPRNSTATLKAKVAPGATASIIVHYKSGPSKAAGLESIKADSNGNVSWSWHVGGNTTLGNWRITVSSGNSTAETTFEVVH